VLTVPATADWDRKPLPFLFQAAVELVIEPERVRGTNSRDSGVARIEAGLELVQFNHGGPPLQVDGFASGVQRTP